MDEIINPDRLVSDSDFEDHLKTEHSGAGHTHIASATWEADGTQHWHPCRYCDDKKLNAANHEFYVKGVCKVCTVMVSSTRGVRVMCRASLAST